MIVSDRIPIPKNLSDIINILISGVIVYLLVISRAGEILFPEGAIGKDGSDTVSLVGDDVGHSAPILLVDDDHRHMGMVFLDLLKQFHSGYVRHFQVKHDHGRVIG